MARKSRKQNNAVVMPDLKPKLIQTAAYVRLSVEDRAIKGTSIENQQSIISNYIYEHTGFELYDTYIDLGVSGTTFERPGFQRMMRDAEIGKISCIMVKDLSRLGRNAIDMGYYVEKLFPSIGIRLIAITDNYDSANYAGGIILPLTNLVNEAYVFDISRKTRSQKRVAMQEGIYVGGRPPYGYRRSPDNRHKLIVDTSAAETIRQIFAWAADGMSIFEIARSLNYLEIPSPSAHVAEKSSSNKTHSSASGIWHHRTIERMLKNEIYLGRLIQGKTKTANFARQSTPSDEWVTINEAHEAIVSEELFRAAQAFRNQSQDDSLKRSSTAYSTNIFKGKIFCAHCGGHLERKKNHDKYIYQCVANRTAPNSCGGNRIGERDVLLAVLEQLIQYKDRITGNSKLPSVSADVIPELRFTEMELSYLQNVFRSLYENFVDGVLDQTRYVELKNSYQEKIDAFTQRATELKQKLSDEKHSKKVLQESLRMLNGLAESMALTMEHVDRFVERVEVFRDGQVYVGLLDIHIRC